MDKNEIEDLKQRFEGNRELDEGALRRLIGYALECAQAAEPAEEEELELRKGFRHISMRGEPLDAARAAEFLQAPSTQHRAGVLFQHLRTQDQRSTSHPVYKVRTKEDDAYVTTDVFLTNAAAEEHIATHAHNSCFPHVFVDSGWRNEEWQFVRALLLSLAALAAEPDAKGAF